VQEQFLTSALVGSEWSVHVPATLHPVKETSLSIRLEAGRHQNRYGRCEEEKILEFEAKQTPIPLSFNLQPIAIPAHCLYHYKYKLLFITLTYNWWKGKPLRYRISLHLSTELKCV
jgi:hypothetical protein